MFLCLPLCLGEGEFLRAAQKGPGNILNSFRRNCQFPQPLFSRGPLHHRKKVLAGNFKANVFSVRSSQENLILPPPPAFSRGKEEESIHSAKGRGLLWDKELVQNRSISDLAQWEGGKRVETYGISGKCYFRS